MILAFNAIGEGKYACVYCLHKPKFYKNISFSDHQKGQKAAPLDLLPPLSCNCICVTLKSNA
jgi:hypothetical protein